MKEWMKNQTSNERLETAVKNGKRQWHRKQKIINKELYQETSSNEWNQNNATAPKSLQPTIPRREGILLAKARTNRYTKCQMFKKSIGESQTSTCYHCDQLEDTIEHVLNKCTLHDDPREVMKSKLQHIGKTTELLTSNEEQDIKELTRFLVAVDDRRKKMYEEKRLEKQSAEPATM